METNYIADPKVLPDNADFWKSASEGKLLVPRCQNCSEFHWYPRRHCPFCASAAIEWTVASGRGTIYSFSVMRRAEGGQYVIAYVKLDEGTTMLTNIVDADPDALSVDQVVELVFKSSAGGQAVPMFKPKDA